MKSKNVRLSRRDFLKATGTGAAGLASLGVPALRVLAQAEVDESKSGTIVISIIQDRDESVVQALADAYKEIRPNVEILWENSGAGAGEYPAWLGTQVAAADIRPDIVSGNYFNSFTGYFDFNTVRYLPNPHTGNLWDQDLDWNFFVSQNAQGQRYMLPTRAVHIMWFYNKAMFEQAGVEPPTTWDEFAEVCQALAEALPDVAPVVANYQWQVPQWLAETTFDQYHIDWIETVRSQPGDWNYNPAVDDNFVFDPSNPDIHNTYTYNPARFLAALRDGTLRFDTPQIEEINRNVAKIFPQYAVDDFFVISDPYPRFIAGQAAIMFNGTWAVGSLERDNAAMTPERLEELGLEGTEFEPVDWGTFEMPPMEGPLVISPTRSVESATGEYISIIEKNQEQTELALDFVQFWLSNVGYQPYVEAMFEAGDNFSGPLKVLNVDEPPEIAALWEGVRFLGNAEINYNGFYTGMGGGDLLTEARNIWKDGLEGTIEHSEVGPALQKLMEDNFDTILERASLTHEDLDNPARQPGT